MTKNELINAMKNFDGNTHVVLFADSIFCSYRTVNTVNLVSAVTNDGENFNSSIQGKTKVIYLGSL